jgi:hypothetical protein
MSVPTWAKVVFWRYPSGSHLDGRQRTTRTWLKVGKAPSYRCNWWNRKPRLAVVGWRIVPWLMFWTLIGTWFQNPWEFALAVVITAIICVPRYRVVSRELRIWWANRGTVKVVRAVPSPRLSPEREAEIIDNITVDYPQSLMVRPGAIDSPQQDTPYIFGDYDG